jgi:hypothetical protein
MLPFDFAVFLFLDGGSTSTLVAIFFPLVTLSPGVDGVLGILKCTRLVATVVAMCPGDFSRFLPGERSSVLLVFSFFLCLGFFTRGLGLVSAACNMPRTGSFLLRRLLVLLLYNMEDEKPLLKLC